MNSTRACENVWFFEGVDHIMPRAIIDEGVNKSGDLLLDLLVDTNCCMLNGRLGHENNFTSISHRGLSVINCVFVPHEQ